MKRMVALLIVGLWASQAGAQEGELRLTLKEAVRSAVEKNLDVKAELYNPAISEADIRLNEGIYNPLLSLLTNFQYSVTQPASTFFANLSRQKTFQLNPGVSQLISTGGTLGLTFNNTYASTNARFTLPSYWNSNLTLNFSQPLLKNFGREPTELAIMVARNNKEGSVDQFKTRLMDTVAQVRTEYNKLYSLREDLEVKRTSLELARKILSDTQAQVKAGVLPAMEILNAEFGVASREKDVLDVEKAVRDENDVLRVLLQIPSGGDIIPVDVPTKEAVAINEANLVKSAIGNRPELKAQRTTLRTNELQARVARNRTLPDLSLSASYAATGLDQYYNRDLEKVSSADYPVWSVGFKFEYPLGNDAARNDYIKSRLRVDQTRTQISSLEANVVNEVKSAVRGIETNFKQIDVTARGRAFAEERLRAYIRKNQVGLATTKDVLDVENNLVVAKSNQIKALAGYNDAITQLWRATGEILDRVGVQVSGQEGDALYNRQARE
ncbi:TolC family protein [Geobacter sp.]|uniref:TolC family protein n=1 Tax=Geobacter sp. TaxID=46610 RepID=UPI00260ED2F7|nr:TolC family protein [Geobacter sp.]